MNNIKHTADLTSYAALLGEGFASKINLLTQILQGAHYPSVGRYKEKLLSKLIAEFIPKNFDVGTGFVLFPSERSFETATPEWFDALNMSSHAISRQCDILIYDASSCPVVFRDDDFVILRPESVRSVVEVKGSLSPKEVGTCLDSVLDFGRKWRESQVFYKTHHQEIVPRPSMYALAWDVAVDGKQRPATDGTRLRKQIVRFYKESLKASEYTGMPLLDTFFLYNECEVGLSGWGETVDGKCVSKHGWYTRDGRFIRHDAKGIPYRDGDSTIASLLAGIQYSLRTNFNRFFSYAGEVRSDGVIPYKHSGFECWLEGTDLIRLVNTDTPQ